MIGEVCGRVALLARRAPDGWQVDAVRGRWLARLGLVPLRDGHRGPVIGRVTHVDVRAGQAWVVARVDDREVWQGILEGRRRGLSGSWWCLPWHRIDYGLVGLVTLRKGWLGHVAVTAYTAQGADMTSVIMGARPRGGSWIRLGLPGTVIGWAS